MHRTLAILSAAATAITATALHTYTQQQHADTCATTITARLAAHATAHPLSTPRPTDAAVTAACQDDPSPSVIVWGDGSWSAYDAYAEVGLIVGCVPGRLCDAARWPQWDAVAPERFLPGVWYVDATDE